MAPGARTGHNARREDRPGHQPGVFPVPASLLPLLSAVLAFLSSLTDPLATLTDVDAAERIRIRSELADELRQVITDAQTDPATDPGQDGAANLGRVLALLDDLGMQVERLQVHVLQGFADLAPAPAAAPAPDTAPAPAA